MHQKQRSHYDDPPTGYNSFFGLFYCLAFRGPQKGAKPCEANHGALPEQVDQPTTVVVPSTDVSSLVNHDRTAAIGLLFLILLWRVMFNQLINNDE